MTQAHDIALKLAPARRGSKKGWPTWTGQVPADLHDELLALVGNRHRGDLVAEALREYVARARRKGTARNTKKAA